MSAEIIYIYYMFTDILCLHRDYFQSLLHCPLKRLVYNSSAGVWAPETFIASALKFAYTGTDTCMGTSPMCRHQKSGQNNK